MVGERVEEGSVVYAIHFLFCPNIEGLQINLSELWKGFFLPSFEYADPSDLSTYIYTQAYIIHTRTLPALAVSSTVKNRKRYISSMHLKTRVDT